ncbi:MFS transporter [Streptomyces stramineus]
MTASTDRKWWAFTGVSLISFLGCIDLTIVNTAAPQIQADLGASVTDLQLIVNMFIVALSMFMVTMGRLADTYGRRRVLYTGSVVFALASLGAGLAPGTGWLIAFRFLQGAAGAVLYTSTGAIVQNAFPRSQRGRAIGALYGVNGLGLAVGPLLGGVIVSSVGWHWVFWLNVPLIALALLLCSFSVKESRSDRDTPALDRPGLVLISLGVPAVVLAFTLGDHWGWSSARTLGLLAFAAASLAAFRAVERRAADPIIDFRLFRHRAFLGAIVSDFALACFYATVLFLLPLYLSGVRGFGGYATGALLLPCTAVMAALSPGVGRLTDRYGPRKLLAAASPRSRSRPCCSRGSPPTVPSGTSSSRWRPWAWAGRSFSAPPPSPRCPPCPNGRPGSPSVPPGPSTTSAEPWDSRPPSTSTASRANGP